MITVGGLLLGAVLTAPGAAGGAGPADALANPFDSSVPRVAIARDDEALGLRDPFGGGRRANAVTGRRMMAVTGPDLRDPFIRRRSRRSSVAAPPAAPVRTDLRSPFGTLPPGRDARPHAEVQTTVELVDLRDPFGA